MVNLAPQIKTLDSKTAQRFPNSVFFNTSVFPPIVLKIACKRDHMSLTSDAVTKHYWVANPYFKKVAQWGA